MSDHRFFRVILASLALAHAVTAVQAEPPKLGSLSRDHFQRGASSQITIAGENLSATTRILVDGAPGVVATVIPPPSESVRVESSQGGISTVSPPNEKSLRVALEIAGDAALVERELRAVTPEGVSNPLPFQLGTLPEIASVSDHSAIEKAQEVPLPAVISGVIRSSARSDFYRFKAGKNERLIFDLHAARMGSPLDSSMALLDSSGKELARSEDSAGLDSMTDFTAPETGEYVIQLRDFRHQGGGNYKYRLIAGALPHVASSFPFGGQRGQTVEVQLKGANLAGADKMLLHLQADSPTGKQDIRAAIGQSLANPFPFEVSDLPQVMEQEPNSALDQADVVMLPAALNGRMNQDRDYDAYEFSVQKGQRFIFEVNAWRYGSPLDALLTITDSRGNVLQRNDDAAGSDPRIDYTFPETAEYFLIIEDLLGRGGEEYAYRISASVPPPDFSVVFLPDAPRVRRGDRIPIRCELTRAHGFNEAVKISVEGLPSGLFAEPLTFPPNAPATGWIVLNATHEAPLGSHPLKLVARSVSDHNMAREPRALAGDKPALRGYLTVLEAAPFSVEAATLMATIEQNQTGNIEVIVDRRDGFAGDIKITPEGFSNGREPATRSFEFAPLTVNAGQSRGTLGLKTRLDSEIAVRPIFLRAEGVQNGKTVVSYSSAVPVTTVPIPFVLSTTLKRVGVTALPSGTESAAAEGVFIVRAERRAGFNGDIELTMTGVPEGITATVEKIPAGAGEIAVKLLASEKAVSGKEYNLEVTGAGLHNDRNYRFKPAPVVLTVNAPEAVEAAEPKLATSNSDTPAAP